LSVEFKWWEDILERAMVGIRKQWFEANNGKPQTNSLRKFILKYTTHLKTFSSSAPSSHIKKMQAKLWDKFQLTSQINEFVYGDP